jgi:hypothetical protein
VWKELRYPSRHVPLILTSLEACVLDELLAGLSAQDVRDLVGRGKRIGTVDRIARKLEEALEEHRAHGRSVRAWWGRGPVPKDKEDGDDE